MAVPLKLGKDQPRKFHGKVFCFLPLPIECHLPVHINGHFILHSSRRALWKTTVRDDIDSKQQWNTCLLQAIASSYAQLLMAIKEDYSIAGGEVHIEQVKKYYQTFPSWTCPPPTSPSTSTNSRSTSESESVTSKGLKVSSSTMPSMARAGVPVKASSMTKLSKHVPSSAAYSLPPQSSVSQDRNLPTEEWLTVAKDVFRALVDANALVIAVVKEGYRKGVKGEGWCEVHTIEWCPLKHDNPTLQVYFSSGVATSGSVFERIGMKLTSTQHWIRKHVGCSIPTADPSAVYANFHGNILSADRSFPCPLKYTSFQTIDNFKKFLEYILVSKQLQAKSKNSGEGASNEPRTLSVVESLDSAVAHYPPLIEVEPSECLPPTAEVERIQYPPLIVTADGILRYYNEESDAVIKSSHSSLFQKCLHYFLYPKLESLKIPKIFLLDPSSEQNKAVCMERIDHCLASVLPDSLAHTSCQALGSGPTLVLIDNLWKCFKEELFFQIFLKQILEKWALLLASNGKVYSRFLEEDAVLPIIPLENSRKDDDDDADDKEIDFETCTNVSMVLNKLKLPFLNTETVPPATVKGICPTLCDPKFILQVLYNFHCQSDISNFITGEVASTLLAYFGYIHLKKVTKSLNYLKHLPLFETHRGKFTSLSGKEAFEWPSDMCTKGKEVWIDEIGDVVFLNPFGAWSNLELYEQLEVYSISATEIYCKFVFPKFEDMGEDLRYAHLLHIRNSLFEDALTHSKMKRSPKRGSSENFIWVLKTLPCIGSRRPLRAIREFYDHGNVIFSTFQGNFLFLPKYLKTDFHFEVTTDGLLRLCQEMANKQHTTDTIFASHVCFLQVFLEMKKKPKNGFPTVTFFPE